ncbi:MAG: transglutaminase family protein [Gammaproteobacteria bacterium]
MKPDNDSFEAAIRDHDKAVADSGLDVWIGAEPTFTDRRSESPEWLSEALGEAKQAYACRIIKALRDNYPGSIILRTLGRQYAHEPRPRWSLGLYRRRDGRVLADSLPLDPLGDACTCEMQDMIAFRDSLTLQLNRNGRAASGFQVDVEMGLRILFTADTQLVSVDPATDPRLLRVPVQSQAIPPEGIEDDLAAEGLYLVAIGCAPCGPENSLQPCIELPGFGDVELFAEFVQLVAVAATSAGLSRLVWRGFPPPADASVAWMTLTPDPAVLEVNEAPAASITEFLEMSRRLFDLAQSSGLASYRLNYNGNISESGGGGQFTLGGPSVERSPFFVAPQLLSRLIVYLNHHPSLSYWFAPVYVGSHSQSPRTDENVLESFSELQVALQHLAALAAPTPEFIWRSLSPFLVDTSGNAHRSEINIEKLYNPYLPGRGRLGLVELRAFRMAMDADSAAAIAALLRALAVMLARQESHHAMIEWGSRLHDRFALPFYLLQDLHAVFDDLQCAGLGLGEPITRRLCDASWRHVGDAQLAGCRLDVDLAIEFWPLLGDAAEQAGGSRLVDASTKRLQLTLRACTDQDTDLDGWRLLAGCHRVPLRREQDHTGVVLITGLRFRAFVPWAGLHPGLGMQTPVVLYLLPPGGVNGLRCTLYEWQPEGNPYAGLPENLDEAHRRIAERFVVEEISPDQAPGAVNPPDEAVSDYCLDLRRT